MANTACFRPEMFTFLRQLKRHNNRDWFAKNKLRYETELRDPALQFIANFAPYLRKIHPEFVADPHPSRGSLFRIYRDTRFASDKRPYKTHVGMRFSHSSGKDAHAPVFYVHLEPDNCFVAAGIWHPEQVALSRVRMAIVEKPGEWKKAKGKLELEGDSLARPPRGFCADHPFIEDLKRKDFIASEAFTDKQVCSPAFVTEVAAACRKMLPLVKFITAAVVTGQEERERDWTRSAFA